MKKDEKTISIIQIGISVATLVLTPLFSGLIVYFQLSAAQDAWFHHKKIERNETYIDRKIDMTYDIYARLLRLELLAREIKQKKILMIQIATISNDKLLLSADMKELDKMGNQYALERYECVAKTRMVSMFFSSDVIECLNDLGKQFDKNYDSGTELFSKILSQPANELQAELNKEKLSSDTLEDFTKTRERLIELMIQDIKKDHQMYYKNDG